jgi:hypothetical protein
MPLPDDPVPGVLAALRARLAGTAAVYGERPADLSDRLPCVVASRIGGLEAETWQDAPVDRLLLAVDCYAMGLPAARQVAQDARRAMRAMGARSVTGPEATPDAQEAVGVRRITFTSTIAAR